MAVTTKEIIKVMQAFEDGKPIESTFRQVVLDRWSHDKYPAWNWVEYDYRVALTKPSWDWSHVSKEIDYLARHRHGSGTGFSHLPMPDDLHGYWRSVGGVIVNANAFSSYTPGTCEWQDSLVVRPGYVEDGQ